MVDNKSNHIHKGDVMDLVFASNNIYKLQEIRKLTPEGYVIRTLNDIGCSDELPETGDTIEENALQKAGYVFQKFKINCFADDSGLEIDVLIGEPGVHSAYYAGLPRNDDKNIQLVLQKMNGVQSRTALFKTVIAYVNNGEHILFEGILKGAIADAPRGTNGFGYDPIFIPEGSIKTLAEFTAEEKNKISHRGIAVVKLVEYLEFKV